MINIIKIAVFTVLLTLSKQAPDFKCPDTESENNCDSTTQYCNTQNVCSNAGTHRQQCSDKSATITNGIVCLENLVCGQKKQCLSADGHTCSFYDDCNGYCQGRKCIPRVALGATCGFSEACLSNQCDEVKKLCVVALNDSCMSNTDCQTGAICSSNEICLLETEQNAGNTDKTSTSTENSSSGEIRCLSISAMVVGIAAFLF